MQIWAKEFYNSKAWKETRQYIFNRDFGLCVRCGAPGEIVHHKKYLTRENINNPNIALGLDNLELLCRTCHAIEHEGESACSPGLMFDENGNLIERSTQNE